MQCVHSCCKNARCDNHLREIITRVEVVDWFRNNICTTDKISDLVESSMLLEGC